MSLSLTSVFTRVNRCMSAGEIYTSTEKQLLSCMLVAYQLQPRMNCSCWGVGEVNMLHSACSSKRFALHVTIKNKRNSVVKEKHFPPWLHKQVDETAKKLCAASFFISVHPAEASLHVWAMKQAIHSHFSLTLLRFIYLFSISFSLSFFPVHKLTLMAKYASDLVQNNQRSRW